MNIRIGTRKSHLALVQTNLVIAKIRQILPQVNCVVVPIMTTGDKITHKNLYDIGGKALFLKELEEQLLVGKIDIAVHSLKDVPGLLGNGLAIAAVLEREDAHDVLISDKYSKISQIPGGSKVGTSSWRRKVIASRINPEIDIIPFRGNIDNRLAKLKENKVDAAILAMAGLKRTGLFDPSYCHVIPIEEMLPAAGQGIIGLEICIGNAAMEKLCHAINHLPSWHLALAERSFLTYLNASCDTPLSAYAIYENGLIKARYMLSDYNASFISYHTETGTIEEATLIGSRAAEYMLRKSIN